MVFANISEFDFVLVSLTGGAASGVENYHADGHGGSDRETLEPDALGNLNEIRASRENVVAPVTCGGSVRNEENAESSFIHLLNCFYDPGLYFIVRRIDKIVRTPVNFKPVEILAVEGTRVEVEVIDRVQVLVDTVRRLDVHVLLVVKPHSRRTRFLLQVETLR